MGLIGVYIFFIQIILFLSIPISASADWHGPVEVVSGGWGSNDNNFGYYKGEVLDTYPREFLVMSDGKILIEDASNNRFKIYEKNGELLKVFIQPGLGFFEFSPDTIISTKKNRINKIRTIGLFNIQSEEWIWVEPDYKAIPQFTSKILMSEDKKSFKIPTGNSSGVEYSATGAVLDTFADRPLLFGKETKYSKNKEKKYVQVIEFEDVKYGCVTPTPFGKFRRDSKGYLYGISRTSEGGSLHTRIYKITKCGKIVGTVDFPADKETFFKEDEARLDEAYGQPVFAPNGDVYTWKRTPTHYSILKWTWQDDPNMNDGPDAPTEPQALPSTSGVYLTWSSSPQDPGCVTGYDVERSTSATGIYTKITTLPLDEEQKYKFNDTTASSGQTWYYRIKATSDIGDSDPVAASATRP